MSERVSTSEREPTVDSIRGWLKRGFEVVGIEISDEDLDFLFVNDDGTPVDLETATENAIGWILNEGLEPEEFGDPGYVEKLAKE